MGQEQKFWSGAKYHVRGEFWVRGTTMILLKGTDFFVRKGSEQNCEFVNSSQQMSHFCPDVFLGRPIKYDDKYVN